MMETILSQKTISKNHKLVCATDKLSPTAPGLTIVKYCLLIVRKTPD